MPSKVSAISHPLPREPEIDGLRALAVVPVVLYHAGWSVLPGGFVGVDIFFVISGYLITRILDREISAGDFSFARFYERRARRILPALFAVVAAAIVAAVLLLLPKDLVLFGKSLLYAILSASNVYFYQNTGYFDAAADTYPLLHTWSLAVEEQFYLVFPIVLFLVGKLHRTHGRWVVALVGVASLALSVATSHSSPSFAFYLPFTRAWELMAGSMLALGAVPPIEARPIREVLAGLALLAIVGTVLLLPEGGDFPGWIAAIPVLGAAGLIQFSPGTLTGRLLRQPVLLGIGLISYSLYLWHWPLLVFASYWLIRPLTVWEGTAVALVAVALAAASWRFVEQPFRSRTFWSRRVIFAAAAAGIGVVSLFCALAMTTKGFPQRVSPEVKRLEAFSKDVSPKRKACHDAEGSVPPQKACALGAKVAPTIAVWSDSHGVELAYALGELAKKSGRSVLELSSSSCAPGIDYDPGDRPGCPERNRAVLDYLLATPDIKTVIMVASRGNDGPDYLGKAFAGLETSIAALRSAGRTVVLEYPLPRDRQSVPQRLARQQWAWGRIDAALYPMSEHRKRLANTIARMDDLVARYGLVAVYPTDALCPKDECLLYLKRKVLYFDSHHPSLSAERMVAPLYSAVLAAPAGS